MQSFYKSSSVLCGYLLFKDEPHQAKVRENYFWIFSVDKLPEIKQLRFKNVDPDDNVVLIPL